MTTSKSYFEQLLSKIYANSFRKNDQKLCIKPNQDQVKISLSVKTVVELTFMCSIIKILYLKYCPVCNV